MDMRRGQMVERGGRRETRIQFGGIGALFGDEIDMLKTPDPLYKPGLAFEPVFDHEQLVGRGKRRQV